jgi:methionine-rich copper-binding protein CopC
MTIRSFAAMAALLALTAPAYAHAHLKLSDPAAGAAVTRAPKELSLTFTEALEPALSGVSITDGQDHDLAAKPAQISGATMILAVKPLAAGSYHVSWHAVAVDTHRTEGTYDFTVKP